MSVRPCSCIVSGCELSVQTWQAVLCWLWAWPQAVVWGECVCAPVSEHAHAAGVGGYPVFWVEAGMEGC